DGHDAVGPGSLEGRHAVLDVLDGGVGLDLAVHSVGKARGVQQGSDLAGHAEADQVRVRADKSLLVAPRGQLGHDVLDRAVAVVRDGVQYNAVSHSSVSFALCNLKGPTGPLVRGLFPLRRGGRVPSPSRR